MELSEAAVDLLIRSCMAQQGFEYSVGSTEYAAAAITSDAEFSWALSVEEAQTLGYGRWLDPLAAVHGQSEMELYFLSLDPGTQREFDRALFGNGDTASHDEIELLTGGCLSQARAEVRGNQDPRNQSLLMQIETLALEVRRRLSLEDDYVDAMRSWKACMAKHGYDFSDPSDPVAYALSEYREVSDGVGPNRGAGSSTAEERELATLDAGCRESSQVAATLARLSAHVEHEVLLENEHLVLAWNEARQGFVPMSYELLGIAPSE